MARYLEVSDIVQQWRNERPDLDVEPMLVIGTLSRASLLIDRALDKVFGKYKLSAREFDILATLRRRGAPYAISPSQIVSALMINNSTLTSRLDRLEQAGWLRRMPIEGDRRSVNIQLTDEGLALINRVVEEHVENERDILSPFSEEEKNQLRTLLGRVEKHLVNNR
ncbi:MULTISPECIES: MarR family winged helix-turn-helix transcriptional regulator [Dickeya]|jgi:DNA-binding MarR family transcriptional regulator|uniref:MarR family transcriptional regulator n=3 Tax=Dickeya TaxID=204037 RepID=A0A2K9Q9L7_9GAMM|nr:MULTISPECIES: MarR family transcriptional regulator [Dickeya]PXW45591.1 DNA-binding MarR family transcriptional regulator [Erwinia sp. AG740]ACZ74978.1 transcriptional regulator, MarR family [Dickeya parazeae Ech586]AUQ23649.1 MarR family transcriptional regulator [Dickeya zeae]MBP2836418.1 MarR family transcriptional regulator [Dickeya parazeae]MBP2849806.1 MarR family transcriptional regulator [Dickeya oryzae]